MIIIWLSLVVISIDLQTRYIGNYFIYLQKENQPILRQWQYPAQEEPVRDGPVWWVFTRSQIGPTQDGLFGRVLSERTVTCFTKVTTGCFLRNYNFKYFKVVIPIGLLLMKLWKILVPLSSRRREAWHTFLRGAGCLGMVLGKMIILWLSLVRTPVFRLGINLDYLQKENQLILRLAGKMMKLWLSLVNILAVV